MPKARGFFAFIFVVTATFGVSAHATQTQTGNPAMNEIRRVVTGNVDGKSVFAIDEKIAPTTLALVPGSSFTRLFGTQALQLPVDGTMADIVPYYPPIGGATVTVVTLPPDPKSPPPADFDPTPLIAEAREKLPGLLELMEPDGMHKTETVDFITILSGKIILELDDGVKRQINAGNVVIQNGTRRGWRNPFDDAAVMFVVSVGVTPDS